MDVGRIEKNLKKLLESGKIDEKIIYILGANEEAVCFIKIIGNKRIRAVLDSQEEINGLSLCGIPVHFLEEELVPYSPQKVILLTDFFSGRDIDKLNMMGYLHNVQRFWICEPVLYKKTIMKKIFEKIKNLGIYKLVHHYILLQNAKSFLEKIYLQGVQHIYFSPYPSIGDIYIYGQYLHDGKIRNDETSAFLVCGAACKAMAQECGFQRVISLESELMTQICVLKCILGDGIPSLESLHYDYYSQVSVILSSVYRNGITFDELFEKLKFGVRYSLSNKIINDDRKKTEEYCRRHKIAKGNSVILAPYAKSVPALSMVFWEELARQLKKAGYKVFMNKGGTSELTVPDTIPISPPFSILGEVIEYAGAIISLRSGICDICSYTSAKKIILYPTQTEKYGENYIKHVGFSNFPSITRLIELECDKVPGKDFAKEVVYSLQEI